MTLSTDCGHGWRNSADCDTCTLQRVAPQASARIADLEATLQSIVQQCIQANDPEHHTLGLVKNMAKQALERQST